MSDMTDRGRKSILVIEKGKIAEIGSYDELMERKGVFYRMEMTK